jgi:glycine/D-amino acid oxidase-like deaminating enzyme
VYGRPIVGPLPGTRGLYVAVTHSGVTLAAHLSQLIAAELTATSEPAQHAELTPYRPSRFLSAATPDQPAATQGLPG